MKNYKQTLLTSPELNKHRDMRLTYGCEVLIEDEENGIGEEVAKYIRLDDKDEGNIWADVAVLRMGLTGGWKYQVLEGMYVKKKLGHPPTLNTLLLALEQTKQPMELSVTDKGVAVRIKPTPDWITIPLQHTYLADIPEDDPMWESLCRIMGLIK